MAKDNVKNANSFQYVECSQKHCDCFAYMKDSGNCKILIDTHFKRDCLFYKKRG